MKRRELKARTSVPANPKRTLMLMYDNPPDGLVGGAGHHDYTEKELRLLESWHRITSLTGLPFSENGRMALIRRATRLLASAPCGYVWISGGRVGWSLGPPLYTMKQGATVWPAASELD